MKEVTLNLTEENEAYREYIKDVFQTSIGDEYKVVVERETDNMTYWYTIDCEDTDHYEDDYLQGVMANLPIMTKDEWREDNEWEDE